MNLVDLRRRASGRDSPADLDLDRDRDRGDDRDASNEGVDEAQSPQASPSRQDHTTARFIVDHTEQVSKSNFPTEKVYGPASRPELRLITCDGRYERQAGGYDDNLIVYAILAQSD